MEKELKFKILNEDDYIKISDALKEKSKFNELVIQENYYYDTENMLLLMKNSVLRARVIQESVLITLKEQRGVKDGYFVSEETGQICSLGSFQKILKGEEYILDILCSKFRKIIENIIGDSKLILIGKSETERMTFIYKKMRFELDKTNFGKGFIDYEIEVESINEKKARNKLDALFHKLKIQYEVQNKTKYQRFLEFNKI